MPPSKSAPTVFYARDKSPFEEHNSPRASIEDGDAPLTNVVSDIRDDQSETEEFQSPDPDDLEQGTEPDKRSLSSGEESDDEGANEEAAPPAKRQRRSKANDSGSPRRSKRISSSTAVKDKPAPVSTTEKKRRGRPPTKSKLASLSKRISSPTSGDDEDPMAASAPVKKRRGRPPAKSQAAARESNAVAKRGPGRPPSKSKVTRRESTTEWEVEKILKSEVDAVSKEHLYLIKWKGFGNKENTWEPKKNLSNCKRLIEDYETKE